MRFILHQITLKKILIAFTFCTLLLTLSLKVNNIFFPKHNNRSKICESLPQSSSITMTIEKNKMGAASFSNLLFEGHSVLLHQLKLCSMAKIRFKPLFENVHRDELNNINLFSLSLPDDNSSTIFSNKFSPSCAPFNNRS
jgi:hypothetical protein